MQKRRISGLLRKDVRRTLICCAALALGACGPKPEPAAPRVVDAVLIKDHTSMMPLDGRVATRTVPHVLDQPKLPGGTVADYDVKGKKYQLFIVDTDADQQAAFALMDAKGMLRNPEYISYMGGYFGTDAHGPVYIFSKLHYLAGVVGLPKEEADPIARVLAVHLK